ncbi:MAG TPA: hypothetical protein VF173_31950 [Thermoanaerobaculia bacterium]|nr:hypothetical protein [Thermoanaerobaculia bacterium]
MKILGYLWAGPTTLLGLLAVLLTTSTRGRFLVREGILGAWGGFAKWFLSRVGARAMTLGHVVIARGSAELDSTWNHEREHVRQVELWGPFFIPAYLLASVWAALRGGHYYRDNWFERDAVRGESQF